MPPAGSVFLLQDRQRRPTRFLSLTGRPFRSGLGRHKLPFQLKHVVLGPSRTLLGPGSGSLMIIACALGRSELDLQSVQAIAECIGTAALPFLPLLGTVCPCLSRICASYGGVGTAALPFLPLLGTVCPCLSRICASYGGVGTGIGCTSVHFGRVGAVFGLFGPFFSQFRPLIRLFNAGISCYQ
jgi:hypothetical protein